MPSNLTLRNMQAKQRKRNNMSGGKEKKLEAMEKINAEVIALKIPLADERRANGVLPVIGEGDLDAKLMFIGEAPGKKEAVTGRPFCGASGKFLDVMLDSIGLPRASTYITSIVKDRPTDNRDPSDEEIAEHAPFLDRQIEIIQPKGIVTLGRISMAYIMKKFGLEGELKTISQIHGKHFKVQAPWGGNLTIVPLYHPAVALYKGSNRAILLEDFKTLKGMI